MQPGARAQEWKPQEVYVGNLSLLSTFIYVDFIFILNCVCAAVHASADAARDQKRSSDHLEAGL